MAGFSDGVSEFFILRASNRGKGGTGMDIHGYDRPLDGVISILDHARWKRTGVDQIEFLIDAKEMIERMIKSVEEENKISEDGSEDKDEISVTYTYECLIWDCSVCDETNHLHEGWKSGDLQTCESCESRIKVK